MKEKEFESVVNTIRTNQAPISDIAFENLKTKRIEQQQSDSEFRTELKEATKWRATKKRFNHQQHQQSETKLNE